MGILPSLGYGGYGHRVLGYGSQPLGMPTTSSIDSSIHSFTGTVTTQQIVLVSGLELNSLFI